MVQVPEHEVDLLGEGELFLVLMHDRCCQSWYQCVLGLVEVEVEVGVKEEVEVGKKPGEHSSLPTGQHH